MSELSLVARLERIPGLAEFPREELEWLVAHGELESLEAGAVIAPIGERIEEMWILLSGHVVVDVDRGIGPRRVVEWRAGEVSGMLPYSRMKGPPGHNYTAERTELLTIHERHFPEMVHRCPVFTSSTVHSMLDRARMFNTSDLHDEKMVSLGKLAAGLAHELNNPASATVRSAKLLLANLSEADDSSRALTAAGVSAELLEMLERLHPEHSDRAPADHLSPIELADREDELADWLERHGLDLADAATLASTGVTIEGLEAVAARAPGPALGPAVRWLAAHGMIHSLADEICRAATRIHELVSAVKRFSYMDNLAKAEAVEVEHGLRDTIKVLTSKAREKGAQVSLHSEPNVPRVRASGSELNQVWMNLIDNALDAVSEGGHVDVTVEQQLDRVVVRVVDDGPGIPPDVVGSIFDPFFTTKAPGQGTGLGLDIARRLVRRHFGDISVESEPGRTSFCVTLHAEEPVESTVRNDGRG